MNDFETVRKRLYAEPEQAALDRIEAAFQDAETDLQMHEAEVERLRGENYALTMRVAALRAELKDKDAVRAALAKEEA